MRFLALALAALIGLTSPSLADERPSADVGDGQDSIIMDLWSNPMRCSIDTARSVTIRQLVADSRALQGTCVAVRGYWQDRALFESDRVARNSGSNFKKEFAARRIGLYGAKALDAQRPSRGPFIAVGMAGDCASLAQGAMMVMGYCHYTEGPYIALSELKPEK